jgi:phospholipid transport system transporter-binding protein
VTTVEFTAKEGILFINGELSRYSLALIRNNNYSSYLKGNGVVVDLSQVTKVDTAGLAWLFCFLEQANMLSCQVTFSHLPEKLHKLIALSGVDGLLPMTPVA